VIGDDWYDDPAEGDPLRGTVGTEIGSTYFGIFAAAAAHSIGRFGVAAVNLQPGNGTAYRLVVAVVPLDAGSEMLAEVGCPDPLAVVWAETPHGHVFRSSDLGILHENYVAEKMGVSLADAWVIGRFLTALRIELAR